MCRALVVAQVHNVWEHVSGLHTEDLARGQTDIFQNVRGTIIGVPHAAEKHKLGGSVSDHFWYIFSQKAFSRSKVSTLNFPKVRGGELT